MLNYNPERRALGYTFKTVDWRI